MQTVLVRIQPPQPVWKLDARSLRLESAVFHSTPIHHVPAANYPEERCVSPSRRGIPTRTSRATRHPLTRRSYSPFSEDCPLREQTESRLRNKGQAERACPGWFSRYRAR